eukprot:7283559-Prymnesium_polylepis.1
MLRQALAPRRALLLLDGLDEGGAVRERIERHATEVLARQGHILLATSRPAVLDASRFSGFRRLFLSPLSEAQQMQALKQRLGLKLDRLMPWLESMSLNSEGHDRITSNPLMLSMVASVFELRQDIGMPETSAELYKYASDAMLKRCGVSSDELRRLLQAVFFEAHVSQRRQLQDRQLDEAALGLERPEQLASIRSRAAATPFERLGMFAERPELGHYVEVLSGEHARKR